MALTEARKNEIAYALLKLRMSKERTPLSEVELKRSLGNLAKDTGVPSEELHQFAEHLIREMVDDAFKTGKRVHVLS
jgi:hypothetical protein